MLNCRACLWRCIQALNVPPADAHRLHRHANPLVGQAQRRLLSTDGLFREVNAKPEGRVLRDMYAKPASLNKLERLSKRRQEPWQKSAVAANQKKWERSALRQEHTLGATETPNLSKLGKRDPTISVSDWERRKKELRYLQDPLELASFVRSELHKGRAMEMRQLVRMASHSMQCVVSWNHLIDHYLANERVNDALKIYNEVRLVYHALQRACLT